MPNRRDPDASGRGLEGDAPKGVPAYSGIFRGAPHTFWGSIRLWTRSRSEHNAAVPYGRRRLLGEGLGGARERFFRRLVMWSCTIRSLDVSPVTTFTSTLSQHWN